MTKLLVLCFLFSVPSFAFKVPPLTRPVEDTAKMMGDATRSQLEQVLRDLNRRGNVQLQILTVPNLQGETIEQASIQIVDEWKLGSAEKDNGVLLLVAKDERKLRIEVGQGLEGSLPDIYAKRIIEGTMLPFFRNKQFDHGFVLGIQEIIRNIDPLFAKENLKETASGLRQIHHVARNESGGIGNFLFLLIISIFIIPIILGGNRMGSRMGSRRGGWGSSSGWSGGRGGFSGGGGWSGGGGGFSGGGASGGW